MCFISTIKRPWRFGIHMVFGKQLVLNWLVLKVLQGFCLASVFLFVRTLRIYFPQLKPLDGWKNFYNSGHRDLLLSSWISMFLLIFFHLWWRDATPFLFIFWICHSFLTNPWDSNLLFMPIQCRLMTDMSFPHNLILIVRMENIYHLMLIGVSAIFTHFTGN